MTHSAKAIEIEDIQARDQYLAAEVAASFHVAAFGDTSVCVRAGPTRGRAPGQDEPELRLHLSKIPDGLNAAEREHRLREHSARPGPSEAPHGIVGDIDT
jgi:hypothetical protein